MHSMRNRSGRKKEMNKLITETESKMQKIASIVLFRWNEWIFYLYATQIINDFGIMKIARENRSME